MGSHNIARAIEGEHIPCRGRTEWRLLHLTEAGLSLALSCATRPLAHLRRRGMDPNTGDSGCTVFMIGEPQSCADERTWILG
jgi:hypothetical protein